MKAAILCLLGALVGVYLVGVHGLPATKLAHVLVLGGIVLAAAFSLHFATRANCGVPICDDSGDPPLGIVEVVSATRVDFDTMGVIIKKPNGEFDERLYLEVNERLFDPAISKFAHLEYQALPHSLTPHWRRLALVSIPDDLSTEPIDFTEDEPVALPRADKPHATAPKVP